MTDEVNTELVTEPEKVENDAIVEQADATPAQDNAPVGEEKVKQDKVQKRFDELTREKYEARRAAEQARQELEQLRSQLETKSDGDVDIDSLVNVRAAELAQERVFNDACDRIYQKGATEFKDFDTAVANLQLVGMNREFLELVSSSDVGEKIIYTLGQDFEQAERFARLPPLQMARELAKLEIKLSEPPKKKVSSVPSPISTISGTTTGAKDPGDIPFDEYLKWRRNGR